MKCLIKIAKQEEKECSCFNKETSQLLRHEVD